MNQNTKSFLSMLSFSEGTSTVKDSDDGYNVLVGGTLFDSYKDHPRKVVILRRGLQSTAAGRYQVLSRIFDHYKPILSLKDFGHEAQDKIALQLIKECRAVDDIESGRIEKAIEKCRSRWASLPGAGYGQHENKIKYLIDVYVKSGGTLEA